jgi:hypothetical protein
MSTDLQSACEHFDKAFSSLLEMNDVLREDLEVLFAAFPDQSGQVLRRNFIRASWAYVEAVTFAFQPSEIWQHYWWMKVRARSKKSGRFAGI